ncbi:MAG: recombinase family protein [Agarilytica sp.]
MDIITPKRCAIYTRKSSEEGLEQNFNSLHAQREAGEAYIRSQVHEGWTILSTSYDDGGFSGGSTERPGLQKLLKDIEDKKIDVIVVYKVDRLSRSLNDFALMMNLFDKNSVSFVSVTQAFNTTNSMGRLTLNILLSFAQFEREVTGERIRDKIGASKKKGMWMGGRIPIGFEVIDKQLFPHPEEAQLVHDIFFTFVELGSVTQLCKELKRLGAVTKRHKIKSGAFTGGIPFSKTSIYKILNNRIYLGEIEFKGKIYDGQHEAIIDQSTWDAAHKLLARDPAKSRPRSCSATPAPLRGLLFGPDSKLMTPTHTNRRGKRYRYYITHTAQKMGHTHCSVRMLPAGDIEGIVFDQLKVLFSQPQVIIQTRKIAKTANSTISENDVRKGLQSIETLWDCLYHNEQARLLQLFIQRIDVSVEGVSLIIRTNGIDDLIHSIKQVQTPKQDGTHAY